MKIVAIVLSILALIAIIFCSINDFSIRIKKFKLKLYWAIPFIIAILFISIGVLPFDQFKDSLFSDNGMNPIKILILFFSMTGISVFLDELGLFSFLAYKVIKNNKSSQFRVYIALCILVSILTMFTSNDIVILTFTPFIIFFCRRTNCNPIPYLVSEFVLANTWSMMFIIGNPTNIYLGTSFGLSFSDYFLVMAIPTLVAGLVELGILILLFNKDLKKEFEYVDEKAELSNVPMTIFGAISLFGCLVFLILSSYVDAFEMHIVSLGSFAALLVVSLIYCLIKNKYFDVFTRMFKRLPYELIPFLLSMFTISLALSYYGLTRELCELFGSKYLNFVYGLTSLLACNLMNNIPMSVLYSNILGSLNGGVINSALYATIIGSNLGAFITPVGALAGIMWMGILKHHNIDYNFKDFIKYGLIIGVPTAIVAFLMVLLFA